MSIIRRTCAAAACSWIDPATGLPEVDKGATRSASASRNFLTGNAGFRFCNFMEVFVDIDSSGGAIVTRGFTQDSGIYRGPSFAKIPSHAFLTQTDTFREADAVRFTQVAGARTVSPEVLGSAGGLVGGAAGGAVAGSLFPVIGTALGAIAGGIIFAFGGEIVGHRVLGFPPIWSKIQIRIYDDGRMEAQLLQHSLFPSLTFYRQAIKANGPDPVWSERVDYSATAPAYDATKAVQLPAWQARGWGEMDTTSVPGACGGNPWGIQKGVTGTGLIPN